MNKVVLAYSGGLDTSVAVAWLREQYGVDVVTLTVDVGGGSLREGVERRAMSAGASKAYVVDARETFVRQYVWRALQANALYQGVVPARDRARPPADRPAPRRGRPDARVRTPSPTAAPARATTRSGSTSPSMRLTRGSRSWPRCASGMGLSRDQSIDYAAERGIEIPITKASPYSIDVNLWGRSCETGVLEDPWVTPPRRRLCLDRRRGRRAGPDRARDRLRGRHPGVDRRRAAGLGVELVERLHDLGGKHGVGRIDHVEDRLVGIKSREIYEAPAAVILHTAHHALEGLVLSKEQLRFNRLVADELAQIVYDGLWFSALSRDLRTYALSSQRVVSGEVRIRLDHGQAVGRRAPLPAEPVRQGPGDLRRGRRVRPRVGRRASSRSSGCRSASRRRATARSASTTARPGRGRSRCSRTCRRASRRAPAPPPADRTLGSRREQRSRQDHSPPRVGGYPVPGDHAAAPIAAGAARRRAATPAPVHAAPPRAIDRLAFLHEFAQLATQARDWDELMRTVVDRTTVAMGVEVCSFYLLDRTGERLTLAATNGLDVTQVGRVSLTIGQGITGRAAAERTPVMSRRRDDRPALQLGAWLRHRGPPRDALGAAGVERAGGRRAQRPDDRGARLRRRRGRVPGDHRRPPRRDRREGPPAGRGRGAARPSVRSSTRPGPSCSRS